MASTSSLGAHSKTSASLAQQFYDEFRGSLRDMQQRIEEAKVEGDLHSVFNEISKARSALTEKTDELPAWDREIHEQNLREVNEMLAQKRASVTPKSRFTFQRKSKPQITNTTDDTTASRSSSSMPSDSNSQVTLPLLSSSFLSIKDEARTIISASSLPTRRDNGATDLHIMNLRDCLVDLRELVNRPRFLALQLRNLDRCVILGGTIDGSAMVHDCKSSLLVLECRQFRMHSSDSMVVMISTPSAATIEHCRAITFGPLNDVQTRPTVQDFDHISSLQPSTNWSSMTEDVQAALQAELLKDDLPEPSALLSSAGLIAAAPLTF